MELAEQRQREWMAKERVEVDQEMEGTAGRRRTGNAGGAEYRRCVRDTGTSFDFDTHDLISNLVFQSWKIMFAVCSCQIKVHHDQRGVKEG